MRQSEMVRVTLDGERRIIRIDSKAINDEATSVQLLNQLNPVCENLGNEPVEVDLDAVEYLGSPGLNHLIRIHRRVKTSGGEVRLQNVSDGVREVLKLTRLERLFQMRSDSADSATIS